MPNHDPDDMFEEMYESSNTSDMRDFAGEKKKREQRKFMITIVSLVSLFLIATIGVSYYFFNEHKQNENKAQEVVASESIKTAEVTLKPSQSAPAPKTESAMIALTPNAPEVLPGESKATIATNSIQTTDNKILSFNNINLEGSIKECAVTDPIDFCYVGKTTDINSNIYYLKDAVNSRFFQDAENVQPIEVVGALSAATMDIDFSGQKSRVIVIVADNGSGFMIVTPTEAEQEIISNLSLM